MRTLINKLVKQEEVSLLALAANTKVNATPMLSKAMRWVLRRFSVQTGQIMALAAILAGIGAITTGAALAAVITTTSRQVRIEEDMGAYYTAAAGIEAVIADLVEGKNPLDPTYLPPVVNLNAKQATVEVRSPLASSAPRSTYRYLDPGVDTGLVGLPQGQVYRVRLLDVQPYSLLFINFAYGPRTGSQREEELEIEVKVLDSSGRKLEKQEFHYHKDVPFPMTVELTSDNNYTIEFTNKKNTPLVSAPFSSTGGFDKTWIHAKLKGRAHVATSTVVLDSGTLTLRAYLRQLPGSHETNASLRHMVIVESWQRVE